MTEDPHDVARELITGYGVDGALQEAQRQVGRRNGTGQFWLDVRDWLEVECATAVRVRSRHPPRRSRPRQLRREVG